MNVHYTFVHVGPPIRLVGKQRTWISNISKAKLNDATTPDDLSIKPASRMTQLLLCSSALYFIVRLGKYLSGEEKPQIASSMFFFLLWSSFLGLVSVITPRPTLTVPGHVPELEWWCGASS